MSESVAIKLAEEVVVEILNDYEQVSADEIASAGRGRLRNRGFIPDRSRQVLMKALAKLIEEGRVKVLILDERMMDGSKQAYRLVTVHERLAEVVDDNG